MASSEIKMKMSLATAGVTGALSKAKTGISDFSTSVKTKMKSVGAAFAGMFAAVGFAGIKRTIEDIVEMKRAADRLGVSTEMFQKLAHAAKMTGVDTERLADAMKDLDVKLQDGIMRGGSFAELMQELGLDMNELAKMDTAERFLTFSDAIKNASGSLSRFGADEFGDAMFELLPLLEKGSEEIIRMSANVKILSDEQIAAAERAQKKINESTSAMGSYLSIWLAEALQMFEYYVTGASAAFTEVANMARNLGAVLKAAFTLDWEATKTAYAKLAESSEGAGKRIKDAMDGMLDEQLEAGKKVDKQRSEMTDAEIARLKKTGDEEKNNAKIRAKSAADREKALKKAEGLKQKAADEREKRDLAAMTAQEKIVATQDKILKLRKEISEIDPFTDEGAVKIAEKELDVERLITDEQKLQIEGGNEIAEARQEAIELTRKQLELELELAKAEGDPARIAAAQESLDLENQIVSLIDQHKLSREEAAAIVTKQNAALKGQKDLQLELLKAEADGNGDCFLLFQVRRCSIYQFAQL